MSIWLIFCECIIDASSLSQLFLIMSGCFLGSTSTKQRKKSLTQGVTTQHSASKDNKADMTFAINDRKMNNTQISTQLPRLARISRIWM